MNVPAAAYQPQLRHTGAAEAPKGARHFSHRGSVE
jgi:hypothetical protein